MSSIVHAVYENGVFRPVEPVDLPEHTPVEFEAASPHRGLAGPPAAHERRAGQDLRNSGQALQLGLYGYCRTA